MKTNLLGVALLCLSLYSCSIKKVPIKTLKQSQTFAFKKGDSLKMVYRNKEKYSYYDLRTGTMYSLNDLSKSKKVYLINSH